MRWAFEEDHTTPIITAKGHVQSAHGDKKAQALPHTCVIFEIGSAMRILEEEYDTIKLIERLPCFLDNPKCISIQGVEGVCFTRGGYGAPAAVDTLETLLALGVKRIIVVGMCGVYAQDVQVGDIIVPHKIISEEGTSRHYYPTLTDIAPDTQLLHDAYEHFENSCVLHKKMTVTTDAVYRQTFYKEALWREKGCVGVEMESSALLSVSKFYGVPAVSILLASDKHPLSLAEPTWDWGHDDFSGTKRKFVLSCICFAIEYGLQKPVDKRGVLDEEVFAYRVSKDHKVFISWHGKQVTILSGIEAEKFLGRIDGADRKQAQLIMAKVTGNFKRGNEK